MSQRGDRLGTHESREVPGVRGDAGPHGRGRGERWEGARHRVGSGEQIEDGASSRVRDHGPNHKVKGPVTSRAETSDSTGTSTRRRGRRGVEEGATVRLSRSSRNPDLSTTRSRTPQPKWTCVSGPSFRPTSYRATPCTDTGGRRNVQATRRQKREPCKHPLRRLSCLVRWW